MSRSELPHERQKANLAEPLASESWWRPKDKNFTDFAKNGVFQQYRLFGSLRRVDHEWQDRGITAVRCTADELVRCGKVSFRYTGP